MTVSLFHYIYPLWDTYYKPEALKSLNHYIYLLWDTYNKPEATKSLYHYIYLLLDIYNKPLLKVVPVVVVIHSHTI
jgi:hypothetical protein